MKKSMLFLLFIGLVACGKREMKEEYGAMCMKSLAPAEVKDSYIKKVESVSIAEVQGGDDVNGKDCADINESANKSIAPPPPLRNSVKFTAPNVTPTQKRIIHKKIIKDGRLGLQVKDLQVAKHQIDTLVKNLGGYYANENLKNSDNQGGYELTIRIPVSNFDKFVGSAESGNCKVLYKEISARDVTEEFVDLETRLASKRNALARYNEIMKKANAMKDIVEIEEAIRNLQEEIESSEGRLRYLNDCVNYSTLTLTISTEKDFAYKPEKRDSFWEKFKESVIEGWFGLVDFILELFGMWPYLILIIPVGFITWRWVKKWKLRRQEKNK
jgi:hypothetical protein